jgi:hypothetical protein
LHRLSHHNWLGKLLYVHFKGPKNIVEFVPVRFLIIKIFAAIQSFIFVNNKIIQIFLNIFNYQSKGLFVYIQHNLMKPLNFNGKNSPLTYNNPTLTRPLLLLLLKNQ